MSPNTAPDAPTVRSFGVQQHHAQRARAHRRHVDDREAEPPEGGLEQQAQLVQGEHVHEDVDEVGVEEAAGHEPVVLAGRHADLLPGDEEALAEEAVVEDHRLAGSGARSRRRRRR